MDNLNLPDDILTRIQELKIELDDGDITLKGYEKKVNKLIEGYKQEQSKSITTKQNKSSELLESINKEFNDRREYINNEYSNIQKDYFEKLEQAQPDHGNGKGDDKVELNQINYPSSNYSNKTSDNNKQYFINKEYDTSESNYADNHSNLNYEPKELNYLKKDYDINTLQYINKDYETNDSNHLKDDYQSQANYNQTYNKEQEDKQAYYNNTTQESKKYNYIDSDYDIKEQSYNQDYDTKEIIVHDAPNRKVQHEQINYNTELLNPIYPPLNYEQKHTVQSPLYENKQQQHIYYNNHYGGFGQTTSKMEVVTKPNYNNYNNQYNSLEPKYRTMPKSTSEGIRLDNNYHNRNLSGIEKERILNNRRPQTHFHIDESNTKSRVMQHSRSESYGQYKSNFISPDRMDFNVLKDNNISPTVSHDNYNFNEDYESSRNSYDQLKRRTNSIHSSQHSINSKENYYVENNTKLTMNFANIIGVLNHRILNTPKNNAYSVIDSKGKRVSNLSWERFHFLIEKYNELLIYKKSIKFNFGSRIGLFFRKVEIVDLLAAAFACFINGLVVVPIVVTETLEDLKFILLDSEAVAVITTETNFKSINKNNNNNFLNINNNVEWLKSSDHFNTFKKKKIQPFKNHHNFNDLAIIEYSKDNNNLLRGIGLSHRTIMVQCQSYREFLNVHQNNDLEFNTNPNLPNKINAVKNIMIGIEPRAHLGLLMAAFISPFCGFHSIFVSTGIYDLNEGLLDCLVKYKVNYSVLDYFGISKSILYHQGNPIKNPDSSLLNNLELIMIDTLIPDYKIDSDFIKFILAPFGCINPIDKLAPILSLANYGGMIVSIAEPIVSDHINNGDKRLIYLDRKELNQQQIKRYNFNELSNIDPKNIIKIISFGNLMPEVTIIIVNPNDNTVCSSDKVGEIWVDSPALSGGYWNNTVRTQEEFHAIAYYPDTLKPLNGEFLKTNLSGSLIDNQLVVFGYLDQIIKVPNNHSILFHYLEDVKSTILNNNVNKVEDCTIFEITSQNLPAAVIVVETKLSDKDELLVIANNINQLCLEIHDFLPFIIIFVKLNSLPKKYKNGIQIINFFKTRQLVLSGELPNLYTFINNNSINTIEDEDIFNDVNEDYLIAQHSGMEIIPPAIDERFGSDLEGFKSITQLLQWRSIAMGNDIAYSLIDNKGKINKSISYFKLNNKVLNLSHHLINTIKLNANSNVLVFMNSNLDYIIAVHACLACNMNVIPYWDFDSNRINEEIKVTKDIIKDFNIKVILINNTVAEDKVINKMLNNIIKEMNIKPTIININKINKYKMRLEGLYTGIDSNIIMLYFDENMQRKHIYFNSTYLLHQCKLHKYELSLSSSKPIITCSRIYNGTGFIHFILLGIYIGCQTIHLNQLDFISNPKAWFQFLQYFNVISTYSTLNMLKYFISNNSNNNNNQQFNLSKLKCILLPMESRVNNMLLNINSILNKSIKLDQLSISQSYYTPFNTLISHRINCDLPSLILNLDVKYLRKGIIKVLEEDNENGLKILDSGKVARDTMIAIVNPVTNTICNLNEVGEIWISTNYNSIEFNNNNNNNHNFDAQIQGGDPNLFYIKTGDLGFLYPDVRMDFRPIEEIIATTPLLFNLGSMQHTIDINDNNYFIFDIENQIENIHSNIITNSAMLCHLDQYRIILLVETKFNSEMECNALSPLIINFITEMFNFELHSIAYFKLNSLVFNRFNQKARALSLDAFKSGQISPLSIYQSIVFNL